MLDLSAAFDATDRSILLARLRTLFGIKDMALKWFHSYLEDRIQCVVAGGIRSNPRKVLYGIPQGSVLGPVLFSMFMRPLADIIQHHRLQYHLYADDSQIYVSCVPSKLEESVHHVQTCIQDVGAWMQENLLQLNNDKTEI